MWLRSQLPAAAVMAQQLGYPSPIPLPGFSMTPEQRFELVEQRLASAAAILEAASAQQAALIEQHMQLVSLLRATSAQQSVLVEQVNHLTTQVNTYIEQQARQ